jgi:hypothetical protein
MPVTVGAIWQLLVKHWPKIVAALTLFETFIKNHPGLPVWLKAQFEEVSKRVIAAQKRRGAAARIRGMLAIIRDVARDLDAHDGEQSTTDAANWIRRADDIELGVRLAETQARADQKKTLNRLRGETDTLLADLLEAARVRSLSATESPADKPQIP